MSKLRTIIVDDEPLARQRMATLLQREADVEVLTQSENGEEALSQIERLAPDLVFLDVRMPVMDGLQMLERLGRESLPAVVFVTAYDEYALPAFDNHAIDYLLKPVQADRVRTALERVRRVHGEGQRDGLRRRTIQLVEALRRRRDRPDRIWLRSPGKILSLEQKEIEWIDGAGNYVRIHAGGAAYRLRHTLGGLAATLDPDRFIRVHRSTIVNTEHVSEIVRHGSGEQVLLLASGQRLAVSRSYRDALKRFHASFS